MKKRRFLTQLISILALLMMLAGRISADSGRDIVYDGKDLKMNGSQNINALYQGLQPGDEVEISMVFANESENKTNWYISNEVLQSLEDSSAAKNGGYTYQLIYIHPDGTSEMLYDNSTVGGDRQNGLHQATEQTKDYFYLDSLAADEAGTICIRVGLDGESQPNSYMNTLAKLQVSFAVEEEIENTVKFIVPNTADWLVEENIVSSMSNTQIFMISFTLTIAGLSVLIWMEERNRKEGLA